MSAVDERLLGAVAAHGLVSTHPPLDVDLDSASFDALLREASGHRLTGLLAEAVADGAIRISDADYDKVAKAHEEWCFHVLRAEQLLVDLVDRFQAAGIDFRLFKGSALAHTVYPDPAQRLFADLDLLVPGEQFDQATDLVVADVDGRRVLPELRPGFDQEFGKESLVKVDRIEVDVHRTFVTGPIGLSVPLDELFADADPMHLAGRTIPTLTPLPLFMQVCINAAVGDFPVRYLSLRDVAAVVDAVRPRPEEVATIATRWRCEAVVQRALALTWEALGLAPTELSRWAEALEPSRTDELLMKSYLTGSARSYTRPAASLLVIPGVRPKFRYLRAILRPSKAYLTARGWTQAGHAKRALGRLRRRR